MFVHDDQAGTSMARSVPGEMTAKWIPKLLEAGYVMGWRSHIGNALIKVVSKILTPLQQGHVAIAFNRWKIMTDSLVLVHINPGLCEPGTVHATVPPLVR